MTDTNNMSFADLNQHNHNYDDEVPMEPVQEQSQQPQVESQEQNQSQPQSENDADTSNSTEKKQNETAKHEPVAPKKISDKKAKEAKMMKILYGLGGAMILLIGSAVGYKVLTPNAAELEAQAKMQAQQSQLQAQHQSQGQLAAQARPEESRQLNVHNPLVQQNNVTDNAELIREKLDNKLSSQSPMEMYQNPSESIQNGMKFDADGNIIDKNNPREETPKERSIKEIMSDTRVDKMSNEQIYLAYQTIDKDRIDLDDMAIALREQMAKRNLELPRSMMDDRQAQRDLIITKEIVDKFNAAYANQIDKLNQSIMQLNRNQAQMNLNTTNAIQKIMDKINYEEMSARREKQQLEQLTEMNKETLAQYKIESVIGDRVWLKEVAGKRNPSYTTGDEIENGIIIQAIKNNPVHIITNKGVIK